MNDQDKNDDWNQSQNQYKEDFEDCDDEPINFDEYMDCEDDFLFDDDGWDDWENYDDEREYYDLFEDDADG